MEPSTAARAHNIEPQQVNPPTENTPLTKKELALRVTLVAIAILSFVIYTQTGSEKALGISVVATLCVCYLIFKPKKKLQPLPAPTPMPPLIQPRPEEQLAPFLRIQLDLVQTKTKDSDTTSNPVRPTEGLMPPRPMPLILHRTQGSGEIEFIESRPASPLKSSTEEPENPPQNTSGATQMRPAPLILHKNENAEETVASRSPTPPTPTTEAIESRPPTPPTPTTASATREHLTRSQSAPVWNLKKDLSVS